MKRRLLIIWLCGLALISNQAQPATRADSGSGSDPKEREEILRQMDERAPHFGELSRRIWEFAEVGYKERQSSDLLKSELRTAGFQIRENVAEIPTAFVATYGQGQPVIGILGEYDALPGLSQETEPEKKPRAAGAPGARRLVVERGARSEEADRAPAA